VFIVKNTPSNNLGATIIYYFLQGQRIAHLIEMMERRDSYHHLKIIIVLELHYYTLSDSLVNYNR